MFKPAATLAFLSLCFIQPAIAADGGSTVCNHCNSDVTILRLYFHFPPDQKPSDQKPKRFKPEIAKLYVDDLYVGDAIVNLPDYVPSLCFPKSSPQIRIEMSQNRKFETKLIFLGNGSTQVLCVDFSKHLYVDAPKTEAATTTDPIVRANAQQFGN